MAKIGQRNIERIQAPGGPKTVIAGTNTSVRAVVTYYRQGHPVEDIAEGLGIRPSDVFDAMAHYFEHREEVEEEIEFNSEERWKKLDPSESVNTP